MNVKLLFLSIALSAALASSARAVPMGSTPPGVIPYGTFASGDLIAGGPAPNQLQDSGQQPTKSNATTRAPTSMDDSTQGYAVGSTWLNTSANQYYVATGVATGAAVWKQITQPQIPFGYLFGGVPANTTYYTAPNAVAGINQNNESISSVSGVFSNLYVHVAAAPGTGNTDTFTLYIGNPTQMTATSVTCTISGSANSCSDTTDSALITAGQAWAVQVVTSANASNPAASSLGVAFAPN
jgi:hypothetical protein